MGIFNVLICTVEWDTQHFFFMQKQNENKVFYLPCRIKIREINELQRQRGGGDEAEKKLKIKLRWGFENYIRARRRTFAQCGEWHYHSEHPTRDREFQLSRPYIFALNYHHPGMNCDDFHREWYEKKFNLITIFNICRAHTNRASCCSENPQRCHRCHCTSWTVHTRNFFRAEVALHA